MTESVILERGDSPLLISIPHDGRDLAPGMEERLSEAGRALPDTDWHVRRLYSFARHLDASTLAARFSRYVVDLNRSSMDTAFYEGALSTGLCPSKAFSGESIYAEGMACDATEQRQRIEMYWQPYHDLLDAELTRISGKFGYALLWDAHSIRSEVPDLFDGQLPVLNIGTNDGVTCDSALQRSVVEVARNSSYSAVSNGRFRGGYITRNYGKPINNIHAIQLETAQRAYMDEESLRYNEDAAGTLAETIEAMMRVFASYTP
ncbi:MAG: N-formylglutamate deformylase [Candidatus Rariloculaceae bacterium]